MMKKASAAPKTVLETIQGGSQDRPPWQRDALRLSLVNIDPTGI